MNSRLGAFIMTYNRPAILTETIRVLLKQSVAPEYILVVDNSEGDETERAIGGLNLSQVGYHRMGYNAGPAGAAKVGLLKVAALGYDWIMWGDDDDPPPASNSIEKVLHVIEKYSLNSSEIGILGLVGGRLNQRTGRTLGFANRELNGVIDADYVPGGKLMIVNRKVAEQNICPSEELFFGFEELDFCLKVKSAGFRVVIDGEALLKGRQARGITDGNYRWKGKSVVGDNSKLWRQYYSTRNLLFVLAKNGYVMAVAYILFKTIIKSFYGYRFGFRYGARQFKVLWSAIFDFFFGVTGKKTVTG